MNELEQFKQFEDFTNKLEAMDQSLKSIEKLQRVNTYSKLDTYVTESCDYVLPIPVGGNNFNITTTIPRQTNNPQVYNYFSVVFSYPTSGEIMNTIVLATVNGINIPLYPENIFIPSYDYFSSTVPIELLSTPTTPLTFVINGQYSNISTPAVPINAVVSFSALGRVLPIDRTIYGG